MNGSPGSAGMGEQMGVKIEPAEAESLSMSGSSGILTPVSPYALKPISPEQEELITRLVSFQCEFEQPSEEDLKRITVRFTRTRILPFCFLNLHHNKVNLKNIEQVNIYKIAFKIILFV